jgi:hypothetical protein
VKVKIRQCLDEGLQAIGRNGLARQAIETILGGASRLRAVGRYRSGYITTIIDQDVETALGCADRGGHIESFACI